MANLCLRKTLAMLIYVLPFGVLPPCGLQWRDVRPYGVKSGGSSCISCGIFVVRNGACANDEVAGLGGYRVEKTVVCWHKYFYLISADNGRFFCARRDAE